MVKHWTQSLTIRIIAIISSVLLLWLCVCSGFLTLFCISTGMYGSSDFDYFNSLLYDSHYYSSMLATYLHCKEAGKTDEIAYYEEQFNPSRTNLRFRITDQEGTTVLTNAQESDQGVNTLAAYTEPLWAGAEEITYHRNLYFKDYQSILSADLTSYLDAPEHYQHWYYTDPIIAEINASGIDALITRRITVDTLIFPSVERAEAFDYEETYGACTWRILTDQQQNTSDTSVVVLVQQKETSFLHVTIKEYYEYRSNGESIAAEDAELEAILSNGLDITVVGRYFEYEDYTVLLYLPADLTVKDHFYYNAKNIQYLFEMRFVLAVSVFVLIMLLLISCIILCKTAGYVYDQEKPVCGWLHRIPCELLLLFYIVIFPLSYIAIECIHDFDLAWTSFAVFLAGIFLLLSAVVVFLLYTMAVRIKTGHFWDGFLFIRLLRFVGHLLKHRLIAGVSVCIILLILFFWNVFVLPDTNNGLLILFISLQDAAALLGILYCIYAFSVLQQDTERLAKGDMSVPQHNIPLIGMFRQYADSLANVNEGIHRAVAEQTKAERMRTALITNVSHDLKTPLTSIVNYVDLMKRVQIEDPTMKEYLSILDRQSARLKKLTEDLVEASKASTGNLTVDLQPTNVTVLISQLMAEYENRLDAKQLRPVLNLSEEELYIAADGRLIWRVFDNLLGNICKYALSGTRIYFDVAAVQDVVCFSLKNISECPLNLSPDELTERFVRGDASRSTEGSGLGLSIAKDLTRLQNGMLSLQIDGDLFKAEVTMPRLWQPAGKSDQGLDASSNISQNQI